ncbi:MAG: glycosyltransferase [Flavobacteriales bacterium]|nr:glycosyltransferase [Flavobacteriales bacterium]
MHWQELIRFTEFNYLLDYVIALYLICFLIQLFYYLFYFARLAFHKPAEKITASEPVSVIICARNERDNLLEFLPLYLNQKYPVFEVIVVNDHSVDDTEDVLKAFALQHKGLKVVNVPDNDRFFGSKKFALTLGIKAAQYDRVLLTDADCRPGSEHWISRMSHYNPGKKIVLGYGAYQKQPGLLNKLIRFETFYTAVQYLSFALANKPYMGVGRNLAYHTELFFANRGFASHQHILSGDDDLFINEVATGRNTQVEVHADGQTISMPKTTFQAWFRQKRRHLTTGKHYQFKHKFNLGLLQLTQMMLVVLFVVLVIKVRPVYLILGVFVFRYLLQMLIFRLISNKLGEKDLILLAPFLEVFFILFNPVVVIANSISRKIKWN